MKCSSYNMIDRAIKITYVEDFFFKKKAISFSLKGRYIEGLRQRGVGRRCPLCGVRLRVTWGAWGQGSCPPPRPPTPRHRSAGGSLCPGRGAAAEEPRGHEAQCDNRFDPLQTSSQNANLA